MRAGLRAGPYKYRNVEAGFSRPFLCTLDAVSRLLATIVTAALLCTVSVGAQPSRLGRINFPNSGPASAQPAFIRGVLLLHNFEYDEAIVAFREAQRIAPAFAMAFWGEAMCFNQPLWRNEDPARARAALQRLGPTAAERAGKAATAREKGYLEAVERLFGDGAKAARDRAYADRMAALVRDYPGDNEAVVFYALALLATIPEGERNPAISLKAGDLASAVLEKNPQHPGAAHYMLHAYDDGEHNGQALKAARIYAGIAPASSHALHMPSHAFLPLGMWDEAAASDEAAFAASVAWVKRTGRSVAQTDFHPLSWLHYEYLQQGRFAKALDAEKPLREALETTGATDASASGRLKPAARAPGNHAHVESEIGRGYGSMSLRNELASMRARYVVESRDWSMMKGRSSFDNVDELFALGLSSVALGDFARADAAIDHLGKAAVSLPDRDLKDIAAIMQEQLRGVLQFARGSREAGLAALARATELEARRPRPIARPYPIKPAAELYGELLVAAGNARAAVTQFENALRRTPRRAASLFGLAGAAAAAGDSRKASAAAQEFLAVWHAADAGRPELADVRAMVTTYKK